jgi:hypothetical protein
MWLEALDGGPGLKPMILCIGDRMVFVLTIAGDNSAIGGGRLVLRCQGDEVSASIEPCPRQRLLPPP